MLQPGFSNAMKIPVPWNELWQATRHGSTNTNRRARGKAWSGDIHHPLFTRSYHIFGPLKETMRGHRFGSHGDIQQAVQTWLREQPNFFSKGWRSLLNNTRSASLCRGTMSKSNMCICSPSVELRLLSQYCLYFLIHPHIFLCLTFLKLMVYLHLWSHFIVKRIFCMWPPLHSSRPSFTWHAMQHDHPCPLVVCPLCQVITIYSLCVVFKCWFFLEVIWSNKWW
jgi:hypothetical protein